ncbi:Factor arrest protein 11 [Ascosphaera atra]|nr:Factor arrest protein 11 [Ascosphaera atra]
MENMLDSGSGDLAEHHIVHADEVDQTGADIATPPEERLMRDFEEALKLNRQRKHEDEDLSQVPQRQRSPELRRDNAAAPPPPMKPPPPAPVQQAPDTPNEMLSLAELRRYMRERPNLDQPAYAFEYADSQAFPEELDEWFQYAEPDCLMLLGSKASFEQRWEAYATSVDITSTWINTDDGHRSEFVKQSLEGIEEDDLFSRVEALEAICYLVCGAWRLTAGRPSPNYPSESEMTSKELAEWPMSKSLQIDWIVKNVSHIQAMGGISRLYDCFKKIISNEE